MLENHNANPGNDGFQSSGDRVEQSAPAHVQCSVCSSTFRRVEHLKRHLRSHTKEKPFECAQCGRHFSRTDTLHRHELSRHTPAGEDGNGRAHRITVKTFRACFSCATARVRCSGGTPCGRCDTRSLECQYPTTRRSKARLRDAAPSEKFTHAENDGIQGSRIPRPSSPQLRGRPESMQNDSFASCQTRALASDMSESSAIAEVSMHDDAVMNPARLPYGKRLATDLVWKLRDTRPGLESSTADLEANRQHKGHRSLSTERCSFPFSPPDQDTSSKRSVKNNMLPVEASTSADVVQIHELSFPLDSSSGGRSMPSALNWVPNDILNSTVHSPDASQPGPTNTDVVRMTEQSPVAPDGRSTSSQSRSLRTDPGERSRRRFDFPELREGRPGNASSEVVHHERLIRAATYNEIHRNFLLLCRNANSFFEVYESDNFPSPEDCNYYLLRYFDSIQPTLPFLHPPTFDPSQGHWLLTLAIVAIGCHYSNCRETDQYTAAFHEMTRRAIIVEKEKPDYNHTSLDLTQARFLNYIGLLHSDNEQQQLLASSMLKDLVSLCRGKLFLPSPELQTNGQAKESLWERWIDDEARRRTAYCIWLLDCTVAYYFDDRPLLSLHDGKAPLPAREGLWAASDAQTWRKLWNESDVNGSLHDALQTFYIEKRLAPGIGWFSQNLLVHALYQRMGEVSDYFRQPLSFWNPSAASQARETAIPTGSVWLPGIPSYSKWRNSTCDCLDIMDWVAKSSTVSCERRSNLAALQLHLARLILLAPFREIRSLATSLATSKLRWSQRQRTTEWQHLWRWAQHDQYKARLCVVHAGATLRRVRRSSSKAYNEPFAAFLAVLIIWAYGICYTFDDNRPIFSDQVSQVTPRGLKSIQLDGQCDDELVQLFVRQGHLMRAGIGDVSDIRDFDGSMQILRVGHQTLTALAAWGTSNNFAMVLAHLADVMAGQSEMVMDIPLVKTGVGLS